MERQQKDGASAEPEMYTCLVCGSRAVTGGLWLGGVICLSCYPEMFQHFCRLHRAGLSRREAAEQAIALAQAARGIVVEAGRTDRSAVTDDVRRDPETAGVPSLCPSVAPTPPEPAA